VKLDNYKNLTHFKHLTATSLYTRVPRSMKTDGDIQIHSPKSVSHKKDNKKKAEHCLSTMSGFQSYDF
jgi:hypothetical protein